MPARTKEESSEFTDELPVINLSTQNNFCGYYALARRIINDKNFAVILDKFNWFYQTDWYFDELVEVVSKMHPDQADIMIGLVIQHHYPFSSVDAKGLSIDEVESICEKFGYNPVIFYSNFPNYADSVKSALKKPSPNEILISYSETDSETESIGHFNLIEPNKEIYKELRDPTYDGHTYSIDNQGGKKFTDNIRDSVKKIQPKWPNKQIHQQIQDDKQFALNLAKDVFLSKNTFFKNQVPTETQIIEHQRELIADCNNLLSSR
jgi:hypothetical protein